MTDLAGRIALLSPEKRALFAARLAGTERPLHGLKQVPALKRGVPAPLSHNQRSVWFLDQLYPGNVAYNSPIAVRFSGQLDPNALEWSWNELIRRHDLLRTVFDVRDGDPVQCAKPFRPVRLSRMEFDDLPQSERMEAAREEAVREAQQPFDLANGPAWRTKLLRCAEREHLLVVILHHIICDGWSIGILIRELAAGYEAYLRGKTSPLPELPIQYADYAAWQREQLTGPSFQRHIELWRKRLEGATDVLQIPLDKPRPAERTFRGARLFRRLSPQLSDSLRRIARREGATLFMVLLGAFKVLLSRYCGESDVIVGSQIANRECSEVEGLIGFFANTLALRTDLSGDPTFPELLARVRETALGAYDSQEVPFRRLVEELKPEKQPNRNPFFEIDFNFRNVPLATFSVPDLNVGLLRIDNGTAKFDLSMEIAEIGSELEVALEYSTELFDASTPARLLKNYQALLERIVANPKAKISQLPLLTEAERHQILVEWNQTTAEHPSERRIHELFEDQVKRTPDAVAIIFGNEQLSYRELNGRANRLAHHLIERGVKPESFVGVMLDRSIDMIVAILATLKAGAAYLPLDSDYPRARLAQILNDAMPKLVLANGRLRPRLPETVDALELDTRETEITLDLASFENTTGLEHTDPSASPAYLIYTSGSTGTPKGVVIPHAALSAYSRTVAEHYKLSSTDRVLQFASLSFDAAVEEIFPTLIAGASLVMRRRDIWTTWECRQKLRELGITVLNLPTAYWEQLVQDWANEEDNLSTNVRLVLVGGEAMRPQSVDLWQRTPLRASRLLNTYGPTEATVVATTFEFPPTAHVAARVPIGKPLPGRLAYILDGNLEPVPVGVPGDLYLGGNCLARGYLNQPKLTAERFVADPHRLEPEARMYKTGDWARWLPDGNIEFIGRSDNQVKIRGFRIELGEVEVLLRHQAGVRDAVVVVQEDEPGQRQLVAYIVSRNGSAPEDLRSFLQGKLPSYMIPQAFVELDALPMTTSGKVDRRALPKPERQLQGYRAPRTPEEGILCGIYADLLSLERVGIDDNFFSLGGHSLLAMQLASRVRRAFGVELALRTVFGAPTVAELIAQLPKAREVSTPSTRQEPPKEFPLSCPQRSVWFLDQLYPGNVAYNSPITLRFSGRLNANALEWSWNELVRRHDVLRTVFEPREGDPVQSAKPFCPARLRRMELGHLPESERMEAAREEAVREAQQPFNLASGPPWRAKLLCCSKREHVLVVILHHIVCDGWSIGILIRELVAGYEAFLRGETAPLPELPLQYADYAAWQREQLAGPGFKRHLDLWRMHLEGVTGAAHFPLDKPRPAEPTFRGARLFAQLPPTLTESLRLIARSEGATLFMVLLGAFKVLLSRYSGESDIIVGSPIANRERYEFEGLIGFFANTLALRTDLSGDPTFVELLARVREVTLRAYDSQEVPFEKLVEELKPERQLDRNPFFDTSFSLQNSPMTTVNVPDLSIDLLRLDKGASKFELSLAMVETPSGLITTVEYRTDLFDPSTAARLLKNYRTLLDGIIADPRQRISRLPLLTKAERERILVQWNATGVEYPRDRRVEELFTEQAKRTPQAVAVQFGEHELRYGELDDQSGMLAHYLRSLGVRRGAKVAICGEPSTEMIVGLLGILKAGAAYVPIDPKYPEERISIILTDIEADVVLTDKALASRFSGVGIKTVCLGERWGPLAAEGGGAWEPCTAGDLAYILFTSGSTGKPKGVCVPHRGISRLVVNCDYVRLGAEDVVAQISNYCFDAATFEIWGALLNGSRLVGIERERVLFAERLSGELVRHGVTTILLTTAVFNQLVHERPDIFRGVHNVLFGGEECDPGAIKKVLESGPPQRFLHIYGPTETTTFATWYEISAGESCAGRIPIGRPIANTQVYILDGHLNALPIGAAGEIWIGGEGVATGYLNRPELTAERFIQSPFVSGQRLYRTGDLGRFLPDGNIEFLGRRDHQVKIRGFRIELGEIDCVLRQHPGVAATAVVVREDNGQKQLVAYFVAAAFDQSPAPSELRDFLRQKLPEYMVPSAFVGLEKLPLTPNGKIDQNALPAPVPSQQGEGSVEPRNETERTVADVWSVVLNLEGIGIYDDFFELGAHSLLATRVVSRLRSIFGVEIPLRVLFDNPTVVALAEFIACTRGDRSLELPCRV